MITRTYFGLDIELPNDNRHILDLMGGLVGINVYMLHHFQTNPKVWPDHTNIPSYCIYMGSFNEFDLYHYEPHPRDGMYSTAIVFGNDSGDYYSGWVELATKDDRAHYTEYVRRQFKCGFLREDDLIRLALSVLRVEFDTEWHIRPAREGFELTHDINTEVEDSK